VLPGLIDITPPSTIPLGPINLGFYGLGYVLAIAVLLVVSSAEARNRGYDPALVTGALITVAVCALIGARLYHVIDQWAYYSDHLPQIVLPPYSGLGLYGGIAGAVVGIAIHTRRHHIPLSTALDVVVPGTLFAQAIARWGNFFNQELYGPPTSLPWGITIDCEHRVAPWYCPADPRLDVTATAYPAATTGFHPLFVYESLLDLIGGLVALWLSRRQRARLRPGDLASFWAIWYGTTRFALESLRYEWDWKLFGVPTAMIIGGALVVGGIATIVARHRRDAAPTPVMTADPDAR
jgi:phosphatidylglycerol:prolipoprotein diacylglycerol transferase